MLSGSHAQDPATPQAGWYAGRDKPGLPGDTSAPAHSVWGWGGQGLRKGCPQNGSHLWWAPSLSGPASKSCLQALPSLGSGSAPILQSFQGRSGCHCRTQPPQTLGHPSPPPVPKGPAAVASCLGRAPWLGTRPWSGLQVLTQGCGYRQRQCELDCPTGCQLPLGRTAPSNQPTVSTVKRRPQLPASPPPPTAPRPSQARRARQQVVPLGPSPSCFSSGITVWQRESSRKKRWVASLPAFTASTRAWSWNTNLGSARGLYEKLTCSAFCKGKAGRPHRGSPSLHPLQHALQGGTAALAPPPAAASQPAQQPWLAPGGPRVKWPCTVGARGSPLGWRLPCLLLQGSCCLPSTGGAWWGSCACCPPAAALEGARALQGRNTWARRGLRTALTSLSPISWSSWPQGSPGGQKHRLGLLWQSGVEPLRPSRLPAKTQRPSACAGNQVLLGTLLPRLPKHCAASRGRASRAPGGKILVSTCVASSDTWELKALACLCCTSLHQPKPAGRQEEPCWQKGGSGQGAPR